MRHRKQVRRLTRLGAVATAAMVVGGLAIGTGTGTAAAGELNQTYTCTFPLIGDQTVSVDIKTRDNQPASIATGTFTPVIEITAISNAGPNATQGLRLVGAETIQGVARATSTVDGPGSQGDLTVQVTTNVPNQPIPASGDLVVNAAGVAPGLRFDQPGTATLSVTDLELEMTPLKADGTPTGLGTFIAPCTPAPNQPTILQTYEVTGAPVTPEPVIGSGAHPPLKQVYNCPFPLIGNQNVTVDISTNPLPNEIAQGTFTPKIDITAVSNAGSTATQGLRLVGGETIQGSALATSLVSSPQGHLAVQVPTAIPNQPIPASGDLVVNASGSAPALRFDQPGTATLSVHDLVLTMTPLKADGTPTGLGTFTSDCTLVDATARNVLQTFTITGAADTEAPAKVTGLTAGETTQTSVPLSWTAATDNVGVVGYDVLSGGAVVKSVEGTSAVVDGLTPDTAYSFTVVAKDAAGNRSAASDAVNARTKAAPDTQKPTAPGPLTSTAATQTSVSLEWGASSDNVAVVGYDVLSGGAVVKSVTGTSAVVDGLTADTAYTFTVVAKDAAGNTSDASEALTVRTPAAPDTEKPSAPTGLAVTGTSANSIGLSWTAASDNVGVVGYDVLSGGAVVASVTGTSATVEGLTADTEYSFTVVAKDAAGNVSDASAAVTGRTAQLPDTEKPSAPSGLAVTGTTQSTVSLSWTAASDNVGVVGYDVVSGGSVVKSVEGTSAVVDGLSPSTDYSFAVVAKDAAGNRSDASAAVSARTGDAPDTQAPSAPSGLKSTGETTSSVSLEWTAASDNVDVVGYDVLSGGAVVASVTGTSATVEGLTADTEYTFTVVAKDAAGNTSDAAAALKVRTKAAPDVVAPSAPTGLRSTGQTENSIGLAWDAATDNVGVTGYDVFQGATKVATVTGTSTNVTGLAADTEYSFTVVAVDAAGNRSAASAAVTARTKPGGGTVIRYGYNLAGSTKIKAANGTVQLTGGIDAGLDLATGKFDADLVLNPTTGNFKIFGFLPVTAKIQFVQAAKTTGTLSGGVLSSTSSVTVKLPRVTVMGIPVSTSPNCQTKTPASIPLQSKPGFDPLAGGTLAGTYTLPELQGCGQLNALISALTAGPGNTIEVKLTPKSVR
ncbi:hypothetical protein GCM10010492_61620 [Saccharothrix mutabilis subsp. mutabilis]|uniref:Fibronectin type-III domain-containing protein n=1 Tax=Saccharothrix mutabilis subsp. mutabilis TaxID=66855 RepID=A0ABP3E5J0_9PSEU